MKTSIALLIILISTTLLCCNQSETNNSNKIVGVWQNLENPILQLEFTNSGEYYMLMNGERIKESIKSYDSTKIQYIDPNIKGQDIKPTSITKFKFDNSSNGIN